MAVMMETARACAEPARAGATGGERGAALPRGHGAGPGTRVRAVPRRSHHSPHHRARRIDVIRQALVDVSLAVLCLTFPVGLGVAAVLAPVARA